MQIDIIDDQIHCSRTSNCRTTKQKIAHYRPENRKWMGASIWNLVTIDRKKAKTLDPFKREVKSMLSVSATFVKNTHKALDF